jgi:hypothetical protein
MPYWSARISSNNQVVVNKLCILIFKLKKHSVTPQDLENLKNAFQEYNRINDNLPGIHNMLEAAHYEIAMVPQFFNEVAKAHYHSTDNSGFHAILEALNPTRIHDNPQEANKKLMDEPVKVTTTTRQLAVEILRQDIAHRAKDYNIRNMSNMLFGSADLKTDHLQAVAHLLNSQKQHVQCPIDCSPELEKYQSKLRTPRSLIVIDAAENKYTCINSELEVSEIEIKTGNLPTQMLRSMQPPPVVLLHKAGRWQACVPKTSH